MPDGPLGDRMKHHYEHRARTFLPCRTWTIIRVDGKCFHTYCRGLGRPFDQQLMDDMATTMRFLCEQIQGCRLGYTQSDEISLILNDTATIHTDAWFDGNVQKIVSVAASLATARFNQLRPDGGLAFFDARVFTIPDPTEVINYLVWRQQDTTRNSISMAAQHKFSPRELHGKTGDQMQDMLWKTYEINWDKYPDRFKRGTLAWQETTVEPVTYLDKRTNQTVTAPDCVRRVWRSGAPPVFTQDRDILPVLLGMRPDG